MKNKERNTFDQTQIDDVLAMYHAEQQQLDKIRARKVMVKKAAEQRQAARLDAIRDVMDLLSIDYSAEKAAESVAE